MHQLELPFSVVKLHLVEHEHEINMPVLDNSVLWVNIGVHMLAGTFANLYQEKVLNEGDYMGLLDQSLASTMERAQTEVVFEATKSQLGFERLELSFEYLAQYSEKGAWAIVPALGVEAFSVDAEGLEAAVQESIRLEFMRRERLNILQEVIATQWFEFVEVDQQNVLLRTYTPSELERLQEEQQKSWLSQVAQKVVTPHQVLFGYDEWLTRLAERLQGRYSRSVLLVGRSGVGKSTLIWELVRRKKALGINSDIWETTASTLIKELTGGTGWQENLALLCRELTEKGDILFVRNLLELFEVGQYEGNAVSMGDFIREYVARGEVVLLSECTDEEYAHIEARRPNYMSQFQVLNIAPPIEGKALETIILEKVTTIARQAEIQIHPEAIKEVIRLNQRYTPYSGMPGKPIRFLESVIINHAQQKNSAGQQMVLDRGAVLQAFCQETGMPVYMVDPGIAWDLEGVRQRFNGQVFGQRPAVNVLVDVLASIKTALLRQGKPIASMLFVGPTGVGKTEMAKVLAEVVFGDRQRMIRFDMSEFSSPYSVARLTGESYFSDGLLTSAVRKEPFCVLLFDELEKAHASFNDLLLQLLGEGRLTDSRGQLVNFCSAIIIMTSNIGAQKLQRNAIGWTDDRTPDQEAEHYTNEVRRHFRPEIFNRIDQVVPFYSLSPDVMRYVVEREIAQLQHREGLSHRNVTITWDDGLYDYFARVGYAPKYGARALQRRLREQLVVPLATLLNEYALDERLELTIFIQNEQVHVETNVDPLKLELILEELTTNEYADYATSLRQNINSLLEGRYCIRLANDLSSLERGKRRDSKRFWQNEEHSTRYTNLLALQQKILNEQTVIERYERDLALALMDVQPLNTQLYKDLEAWEKDYGQLKLELYDRLTPHDEDGLELGIYGKNPKVLLDIYSALLDAKGYSYDIDTVWYSESYWNELIPEDTPQAPREKYYYQAYRDNDAQRWKPKDKDYILVGVEFFIEGKGKELFLKGETGWQQVIRGDQKDLFFVVLEDEISEFPPQDIHRKQFFKKATRPRRIYREDHVEDTALKLAQRRMNRKEQIEHLYEVLQKQFVQRLDEVLF